MKQPHRVGKTRISTHHSSNLRPRLPDPRPRNNERTFIIRQTKNLYVGTVNGTVAGYCYGCLARDDLAVEQGARDLAAGDGLDCVEQVRYYTEERLCSIGEWVRNVPTVTPPSTGTGPMGLPRSTFAAKAGLRIGVLARAVEVQRASERREVVRSDRCIVEGLYCRCLVEINSGSNDMLSRKAVALGLCSGTNRERLNILIPLPHLHSLLLPP